MMTNETRKAVELTEKVFAKGEKFTDWKWNMKVREPLRTTTTLKTVLKYLDHDEECYTTECTDEDEYEVWYETTHFYILK